MFRNKHIERDSNTTTKIFDQRSLKKDYRTLLSLLKPGMSVLDIGCGTGSISCDIAKVVSPYGNVTGIDNTKDFIESGRQTYSDVPNLKLLDTDLFDYETEERYDLVIAARVLQWLSQPLEAIMKMKTLLKPKGCISVLDYNHNELEWQPQPPESMVQFYKTFLRWRSDAGMDNGIAEVLPELFEQAGLVEIQILNADETYERSAADFKEKIGIWSKVAGSKQMVREKYLEDELRLRAISDYDTWVEEEAVSMKMKLKEVRGFIPG